MARVAGVNLPLNKRVEVGLTYVHGVGRSTANDVLKKVGVDPDTYVKDLTEEETVKLRDAVEELEVEGDLRRERSQNIKRLVGGRLLPRPAPPARPADPRPAHEDERPRPQGSAEDEHRRQEEAAGQEVSPQPKKGRARRRVKKNVPYGIAHIKTSFNNTIVTITDPEGNVVCWESAGSAGFKGSRKSTPFAAQVTADAAARKGMEHGVERVEVHAKGAGSGRDTAIRSLQAAGLQVTTVKDVSPQAHNGCRPKKRRRRRRSAWPIETPDRSASSVAARDRSCSSRASAA